MCLTLFVPGNWDKSGVLAGRCPMYNTQHVLALMVWPQLCISLVICELWGLVCGLGDWVVGGLWGTPQHSSSGKGGAGLQLLEASCLRSLVAVPGSEATLVSCPFFVPSPCSTVDPHQSHLGYSCLLLILLPSPSNRL